MANITIIISAPLKSGKSRLAVRIAKMIELETNAHVQIDDVDLNEQTKQLFSEQLLPPLSDTNVTIVVLSTKKPSIEHG